MRRNDGVFYKGKATASEELQAKVSKLEQQTEKNAKAIAKLNKQVTECKYLIQILFFIYSLLPKYSIFILDLPCVLQISIMLA